MGRALHAAHASWVNQIELFFSILQRKIIRNGNFPSQEDLIAKLLAFSSDYDQTATPFAWTYPEGISDALTSAGAGYRAVAILGAGLPDVRLATTLVARHPDERLIVAFK